MQSPGNGCAEEIRRDDKINVNRLYVSEMIADQIKKRHLCRFCSYNMVEHSGIEPLTSTLPV